MGKVDSIFKLIIHLISKAISVFAFFIDLLPYGTILLEFITSLWASIFRLFAGGWVASGIESAPRPETTLLLYEFEGCPFCRKVREHLSTLDLDAIIYPCPKEYENAPQGYSGVSSRFRPIVKKQGGKNQYPYLVDDNTNVKLYESDAIIKHLWTNYGSKGRKPLIYYFPTPINFFFNFLSSACRFFRKTSIYRTHSKYQTNNQLIHLWSHEASPGSRVVRETLNTLEIPYHLHNVPHGSKKRIDLQQRIGKKGMPLIPYLEDSNTGWKGFGVVNITSYLRKEYQAGGIAQEGDVDVNEKKKAK